jgi:hypothetical protein
MQVMSQLAASRPIPRHNPDATSADEAYKVDEVLSEEDAQHLAIDDLKQALLRAGGFEEFKGSEMWKRLNLVVKLVMHMKQGPGLLESQAEECAKWLALLQACCSVWQLKSSAEFSESSGVLAEGDGAHIFL